MSNIQKYQSNVHFLKKLKNLNISMNSITKFTYEDEAAMDEDACEDVALQEHIILGVVKGVLSPKVEEGDHCSPGPKPGTMYLRKNLF